MGAQGGAAPQTKPKKEKIAILGGGIGALATAFELTRDPNWKAQFESITIYQLGWRLGGKCASSRDHLFGRIEEHGIHGFLGSYHNALPMMMECFREWEKLPADRHAARPEKAKRSPPATWPRLETFKDAFAGQDYGMLWELIGREVSPWPQEFPSNKRVFDLDRPDTRGMFEISMAGVARAVMVMLIQALPFGKALKKLLDRAIDRWAAVWGKRLADPGPHPWIARFHRFWTWAKPLVHGISQLNTPMRRQFILVDHLATLVFGAFADGAHARGFDHLDDENFTDFLERHGAHKDTIASPLNLNFINMTYQYPRGDTSLTASMAAGCYVRWALWSTSFVGSFIWRFGCGSGEVLIAPLYEVLKARGVKFEFFQKVTNLGLSRDKSRIERVDIDVQATLKAPEYDPLILVKGVPCWPDRPRYEQLVEGDALQESLGYKFYELAGYGYDLESYWTQWRPPAKRTLEHGKDFDKVVFAISIGAVQHLCKELEKAQPQRWMAMRKNIPAHATMAMQLWLKDSAEELGWDIPRKPGDAIFSTTWISPQNGHAEFAELIKWEDWCEKNPPRGLWYFCGLMRDDHRQGSFTNREYVPRLKARVKYESIQALQSAAGILLPKGSPALQCPPGDQFGLDFGRIYNGYEDSSRTGMNLFDSQFWRANIDPTERYVASPPGSTRYRLKAWESGFENLVLAGDWIYTGINVGSVEGTVMSGRLACHALTGMHRPPLREITGYLN